MLQTNQWKQRYAMEQSLLKLTCTFSLEIISSIIMLLCSVFSNMNITTNCLIAY